MDDVFKGGKKGWSFSLGKRLKEKMKGCGKFVNLKVLETVRKSLWRYYKAFANMKDFRFKDQITRSKLSIPSNITEGYERECGKEITNIINHAKVPQVNK